MVAATLRRAAWGAIEPIIELMGYDSQLAAPGSFAGAVSADTASAAEWIASAKAQVAPPYLRWLCLHG